MNDFLFTNKNINNTFFYKIKIGNFYFYSNYKLNFIKKNNSTSFLFGKIYSKFNNKNFQPKECYDGRYCFIHIKNNKVEVSLDQFSRLDVFYADDKNNFFISSNFNQIVKILENKSINQIAIGHSLNVIGIRPPKKDTFFNEISRIGVNEKLDVIRNKIFVKKEKFKSFSTENYNDDKIEEYFQLNQQYLNQLSAGRKKNIYMSSGFDSSFLTANQINLFGSSNVTGHTVVQKISKRSKIYNIFEIKRILKLKKHFGFKLKFTEVNLVKNFQKYSEQISKTSADRMMTNTLAAFMHNNLAISCKNQNFSNEVYAGEVSDGVHNFGFSQFFSLIDHESNGFREYSDKKLNYLYSPTFIKKIINKNYKSDFIFKEMVEKKYNQESRLESNNLKDVFYKLSDNLFNSNSRLPLNEEKNSLTKSNLRRKISNHLKKEYFSNVQINNPNQIYSAYIFLYNSFHWQASTICTMYNFADANNLKMYLPYWSPKLHNFLSRMPEEWGRGLEMKNIKYPLKESFRRYLKYPKILEEGSHSYMYDVKKFSDPILEIIINPVTKKYIIDIFKKYHPCEYLEDKFYDRDKIYSIINNYKNENKFEKYSNQIFRLYNISKLFYDLDKN